MMTLERWSWRCEHARCGGDIGTKERMDAIASMHRTVSGHTTFVVPYRVPALHGLPY